MCKVNRKQGKESKNKVPPIVGVMLILTVAYQLLIAAITISMPAFTIFYIFYQINSLTVKEFEVVKNQVLLDVCESNGNISSRQYSSWFTEDFREKHTLEETEELVLTTFPKNYDCDKLGKGGPIGSWIRGERYFADGQSGGGNAKIKRKGRDGYVYYYRNPYESGSEWKIRDLR